VITLKQRAASAAQLFMAALVLRAGHNTQFADYHRGLVLQRPSVSCARPQPTCFALA